jgi:hypothetical protein
MAPFIALMNEETSQALLLTDKTEVRSDALFYRETEEVGKELTKCRFNMLSGRNRTKR